VWAVGTNTVPYGHQIYHWTGSAWVSVPEGALTIAVGPDGSPWITTSSHQIYTGCLAARARVRTVRIEVIREHNGWHGSYQAGRCVL
jgi:hypothetical protein